jgi:ABC-type Fe3+/spermidine/putrescine transport system ATPase subunit
MPDAHVRLVGLSKRFANASAAAVDEVSLDIPRGSLTTLLGPSGCGKTTTLRMIAGFYEPDRGDIFIGARRVNDVPAHRRRTAMVFQDYALFPHMTVQDNVSYGLKLTRMSGDECAKRVRSTLDFLDLRGLEGRFPGQLSGGQQQRVALARALVMNPEVLLLDEPLSNLDARLRVSIRGELISIQRHIGITTIYVTHDQDEALAMSDWVAVMNRGQVVQWGTPWDVYYQPRSAFLADFLGTVNLVHAPVLSVQPGSITVQLGAQALEVPFDGNPPGRESLLAIRPETLTLGNPIDEGGLALRGTVVRRTFLGHVMRYAVRIADQEWLIDQPDPGGASLANGEVTVIVNPRRVHVLPDTAE